MWGKIKTIFSSIRFWQVVIGSVVFYLGSVGIISVELANSIDGLLGISITIGTIDKVVKKDV